ncbi:MULTISPECIES: hypothetical protein [unclassified Microbacterium]|uniref:hypothetical protein n=1 Tax=unclassified Microbacterium TaxID=2609290 RepID=UPI00214BF071|nr:MULTISPECIES: hypothetical protein [unclassified Microbacterium]MCR2800386.1 hypothetical protein [Microbacterium sp. zg.Y818]MCR2825889.1 hypothetical protein [Microbacterium sp. zg.Y909]WIM22346.1 hypothetical protein QNO21_14755 [Microbacterium sp. zg-Y818]
MVALTGCATQDADVTPDEAREALTSIIHDTADVLGTDGWDDDGDPGVQSCDGGNGVKWSYGYSALPGDVDSLADAEKVAAHWETLGMSVRVNTEHDPVVFATGGSLQGASFSTGPASTPLGARRRACRGTRTRSSTRSTRTDRAG